MIARAWILVGAVLLSMADEAAAHPVFGITGVRGGLLHPLVVPSHVMAAIASAILIGRQPLGRAMVAVYALGLVAGLGAIAAAYVPALAEEALLVLAAVAGLLVAWGRPLPWPVLAVLTIATGLAHGLDSPPEAISVAEANLTLIGTALNGTAFLALVAWLASRLRYDWQRIGMRIVGSWISASAIMVLALRFAGG
jgi:urease accessory protein